MSEDMAKAKFEDMKTASKVGFISLISHSHKLYKDRPDTWWWWAKSIPILAQPFKTNASSFGEGN